MLASPKKTLLTRLRKYTAGNLSSPFTMQLKRLLLYRTTVSK